VASAARGRGIDGRDSADWQGREGYIETGPGTGDWGPGVGGLVHRALIRKDKSDDEYDDEYGVQ
jgi:hypothetical protein